MEYIIDGYNLIKSSFLARYEGKGISYCIQMFINILGDYSRKHPSVSFTVVFDGNLPPAPYVFHQGKHLKVIFSGEISADEVIRKRVEKTPEKNMSKVVVSDDRGVKDAGHLFGTNVMGVVEFLDIVFPFKKHKKEVQIKEKEVNELKIEQELKRYYRI